MLTERERTSRVKELTSLKGKRSLSVEEAIIALEDGAVLLENGHELGQVKQLDRKWLATLVKRVTGLSLAAKGKTASYALRPGEASRSVSLIRGVTLHLTWDWKLLSVAVDPKELRKRSRALAFLGIAKDPEERVGEEHDKYLAEVFRPSG